MSRIFHGNFFIFLSSCLNLNDSVIHLRQIVCLIKGSGKHTHFPIVINNSINQDALYGALWFSRSGVFIGDMWLNYREPLFLPKYHIKNVPRENAILNVPLECILTSENHIKNVPHRNASGNEIPMCTRGSHFHAARF